MSKVSFDFDGTLSRKDVQEFAKQLVDEGHDVWIVTSRYSDQNAKLKAWWWIIDQNKNLYDVAEECGIKKEHIHFTNGEDKIVFLKEKNFVFHLDDDDVELMVILWSKDKCVPLNVGHFEWKENCLEVLNKDK